VDQDDPSLGSGPVLGFLGLFYCALVSKSLRESGAKAGVKAKDKPRDQGLILKGRWLRGDVRIRGLLHAHHVGRLYDDVFTERIHGARNLHPIVLFEARRRRTDHPDLHT
jgi:hypothetical protein